MSEKLYSYPLPISVDAENGEIKNPNCLCLDPMAAFFCPTGHMLECHSGLTCDVARCSHLSRYEGHQGEHSTENAPVFSVRITRGEKEIVHFRVFAPSDVLTEQIVKGWVSVAPNLSQMVDELKYEIKQI